MQWDEESSYEDIAVGDMPWSLKLKLLTQQIWPPQLNQMPMKM